MNDEELNTLVELFRKLPAYRQDGIIDFLQFLLSVQEEAPDAQE